MGAKIKISYEKPEELKQIVAMLSPVMRSCKVAKGQQGRYKKAYVEIEGIADKMPQESEEETGEQPEKLLSFFIK